MVVVAVGGVVAAGGALACGSFSESPGGVGPSSEAGTADGDGGSGTRFCSSAVVAAPDFLACQDFEDPETQNEIGIILRTEGSAKQTLEPTRGYLGSTGLHASIGAEGGRAQRVGTFTSPIEQLTISMRVFLDAPTTTPVRLVTLEGSSATAMLALAVDGSKLDIVFASKVDGGAASTESTGFNLSPGQHTRVTLRVAQLSSSNPNISVGVGEDSKTTRISNVTGTTKASAITFGAVTFGPTGLADVFIDDVLIQSK